MEETRNNFDGLRLIGAFLVIVSHQFLIVGAKEPKTLGVSLGLAGVALFFGTSGYLVSASWTRDPNLIRFGIRRVLRLWPALALLVGVLTTYAWLYPWTTSMARWQYPAAAGLFLRQLYFHDWDWSFFQSNPAGELDASLWTIPYEAGFYAALGLASLVFRKHVKWLVLLALLGSVVLLGSEGWLSACFLVGMSAFHFKKWPLLVLLAAVVTASFGFYGRAILILISGAAVLIGSRSWPVMRRAGRYGDFSYGLYLWGWPVQQVAILLMGRDTPFLALLLSSIVYSAAVAWISWNLVERQALKLKPRAGEMKWAELEDRSLDAIRRAWARRVRRRDCPPDPSRMASGNGVAPMEARAGVEPTYSDLQSGA